MVFFTLFKLYKWYQVAQNITYKDITLNQTQSKEYRYDKIQ